jgi:hypothetical protein
MDLVLRYLENAIRFRNMAAVEADRDVKARLEEQAEAYQKLARERARKLNIPVPGSSPDD